MTVDLANIPVVIFAGGRGARFDHESQVLPKPMIEVAGKPILQHIIESLALQGFRKFIVAVGHLGSVINDYFDSVRSVGSCLTTDSGRSWYWTHPIKYGDENLTVSVVETGERSHTGQRLWKLRDLIAGRSFVMTYGDGLSDVDMTAVLDQHESTGAGVTMTVVHPPGRFGVVKFPWDDSEATQVTYFGEKPRLGWINGGFMVADHRFIDRYVRGELELEGAALPELAGEGGLHGYRHEGYWRCMDTRRDLEQIEADVQANGGRLPWLRTKP